MSYYTPNFLLNTETAQKLYHTYAKNMPIFDYHCHLPERQILENEPFTEAAHDFELVPRKETVLNVDYRHNGIGSHSCGPQLHEQFRFTEKHFRFTFRLLAAKKGAIDPYEEYGKE